VNQRYFDNIGATPPSRDAVVRPENIHEDEIRYYSEPLSRLIMMHWSSIGLATGISWISPWPRDDARLRG
jgi:hypothetical protein